MVFVTLPSIVLPNLDKKIIEVRYVMRSPHLAMCSPVADGARKESCGLRAHHMSRVKEMITSLLKDSTSAPILSSISLICRATMIRLSRNILHMNE